MMKRLVLLLLLSALPGFAQELARTLMPPTGPVVAGGPALVDLVAMNGTSIDAPFRTPATLAGELEAGGASHPVALTAINSTSIAVSPGSFGVRRYQFTVPAGVTGRAVLEIVTDDGGTLHAVFDVQAPAPAPAPTAAPEPALTPLGEAAASAPVASMLARTFAGRFMPNQPIYFLYGWDADQAVKFQFSFDYRLATYRWGRPEAPKISTLRIGYTQRSLWDIDANSSPFYDTSYMPEVALVTDFTRPKEHPFFTWMGTRLAFQHESNGKAGADSRSLNIVYFRPRFILGDIDDWFVVMVPEIQAYVDNLEDNPDLKDYRGYGKLNFYIARNDGPSLRVSAWAGKDFDHGTYQLDLTWPLKTNLLKVEAFLQAQYFHGYGESLRSYNQKSDALRIGLGLVR